MQRKKIASQREPDCNMLKFSEELDMFKNQ